MLRPKLWSTLTDYSWRQFRQDTLAGIIVGFVALPLAIAFAIASGVAPEKGLITAIIAGFLISALGGSRVQIGGPTGAFVVIVYSIIQNHGIDGLTLATLMAGVILIIMGFAGFGAIIKFIPYPVIIGFTSGIAVIILFSQVRDFLGLPIDHLPADFIEKLSVYAQYLDQINPAAVVIACVTVAIIFGWQKITKRIPGSLLALVVTTAAVHIFQLPVETIGKRFGEIQSTLPGIALPAWDFALLRDLVQPAFTIAILAAIESLLSAVVADGMIGGKHRSNMELIAQGIANIVTPLFGGIPATGAIARTATNVHNGGRTPVAGMVHALTLFVIMIAFAKWAALIPMATLAGILTVVAIRMSEYHSFLLILKAPRSDVSVLLITFALTVLFDLTVAIQTGMVLAAFLLIYRISRSTSITAITGDFSDEEESNDPNAINTRSVPDGVEVFEIQGPFFFGVVSTFTEAMINIEKQPRIRILRLRLVTSIDATAINALRQVILQSQKSGIRLILSGVAPGVLRSLRSSGIEELIGKENIQPHIDAALAYARDLLEPADKKGG